MKLPPDVDNQIANTFENLINYIEQIKVSEYNSGVQVDPGDFTDLQNRFLFLLRLLSNYQNPQLNKVFDEAASLRPAHEHDAFGGYYADYVKLLGLIRSVKFSYEMGILGTLTDIIAATISGDYVHQAQQLVSQDYILPAAVLLGSVLEDTLRRLCQRQIPPIDVAKPNGEPKTLNPLIDDLKNAGLFNELKAKQLRSWADIRNAAAHGKFDEFNRQDVEQMLSGVQNFLADYL